MDRKGKKIWNKTNQDQTRKRLNDLIIKVIIYVLPVFNKYINLSFFSQEFFVILTNI